MGHYANPVTDVINNCRQIYGNNYADLTAQLQEGEMLAGVYDRLVFKQAPLLDSEREYRGFEDQYQRGTILRVGFYACPATMFPTYLALKAREEQS